MAKFQASTSEISTIPRLIGQLKGAQPGPTVILMGGLHGNEPSGIIALEQVFKALEQQAITPKGHILALRGNTAALQQGKRYLRYDLNRVWTPELLEQLEQQQLTDPAEEWHDVREIQAHVEAALQQAEGPVYFLDLHTTSSDTMPFLATRNAAAQRAFCQQFPLPAVLGLDTALPGTLLSLFNNRGHLGLAFEAGSHLDPAAPAYHEAFVWKSLVLLGCLPAEAVPQLDAIEQELTSLGKGHHGLFEIGFRYAIGADEQFRMRPGFENFHHVFQGQELADNQHRTIRAERDGYVFMPLYQDQGEDGFFLVQEVD
ncbi:MAG: succinylglutamate desuccinylase/aspartoacylase family protein [Bacteroidota bacterium]